MTGIVSVRVWYTLTRPVLGCWVLSACVNYFVPTVYPSTLISWTACCKCKWTQKYFFEHNFLFRINFHFTNFKVCMIVTAFPHKRVSMEIVKKIVVLIGVNNDILKTPDATKIFEIVTFLWSIHLSSCSLGQVVFKQKICTWIKYFYVFGVIVWMHVFSIDWTLVNLQIPTIGYALSISVIVCAKTKTAKSCTRTWWTSLTSRLGQWSTSPRLTTTRSCVMHRPWSILR